MKLEDVINEMKSLGVFSSAHLDSLQQEDIDQVSKAVPLPTGSWEGDAKPMGSTWTGNNFRIISGTWYWDDKPGSQCGRDRTWKYTPATGASYRQAGTCPQGYAWFEMYVPA